MLKAAGCKTSQIDEGDLSFRLGPRINAAGRLYRADAGVELFLTEDEGRAEEIAKELNRANSERQTTERKASSEAEAARRELSEELREAPAFVLAGEGWHPGVIGIVASRLVERHYRPAVVIALDGEGKGRGSGRSIPGFDLLAGLRACSEHLVRFGGHRAAAGLEIEAENIDAFREAFVAHAVEVLGPEDLKRTERIDAMIGGSGLALGLAEELEQMGPFGMGNPGVRLLVPSARVGDVRTMGEGKHARFSLRSGSHRALAVAFGRSTLGVGEDDPVDAAVRLEVNRWNGSVEPRVVLKELYPLEVAPEAEPLHSCECPEDEWWRRFDRELALDPGGSEVADDSMPSVKRTVVGHEASPAAVIAELVSSGAGVLAVCADASRRAALASGAASLARFNGGVAGIACRRCAEDAVGSLASGAKGGLALTDYAALRAAPGLAGDFEHVVLVDVPPSAREERLATSPLAGKEGTGFLHEVWGEGEVPFAISALEDEFAQRRQAVAAFKDLRDAGEASGEELLAALRGSGLHQRSPESAARCFRVLDELGIVRGSPDSGGGTVGVVSSEETNLERSKAFQAYTTRCQENRQFLDRRKQR
ncbi:MAG: DHHA1 domain-containing protein [Solirubrobacterales bacterium]